MRDSSRPYAVTLRSDEEDDEKIKRVAKHKSPTIKRRGQRKRGGDEEEEEEEEEEDDNEETGEVEKKPAKERAKYVSNACENCNERKAKCDSKTPYGRCLKMREGCKPRIEKSGQAREKVANLITCSKCREKKRYCDRGKPVCQQCKVRGEECVYFMHSFS